MSTAGAPRSGYLLALLMGLMCACQRDYSFHTRAAYEAPRGGFRIDIEATGIVRTGADLSEEASATARLTPGAGTEGRPLRVEVHLPGQGSFAVDEEPSGPVWFRGTGAEDSFVGVLRQAGYSTSPTAELREVYPVLHAALRGPKATVMEGQTQVLRVVRIAFQR